MDNSVNLNRVRWKCRRGMLELDLILLKFVDEKFQQLSSEEQNQFEQLLELPDPVLQEYLYGLSVPDDERLKLILNKCRVE